MPSTQTLESSARKCLPRVSLASSGMSSRTPGAAPSPPSGMSAAERSAAPGGGVEVEGSSLISRAI